MLFTIYFPVADLRQSTADRDTVLPLSQWSKVNHADGSFQKNLGAIKNRPLGGVRGWIGESNICDIGRAVSFPYISASSLKPKPRVAFKRFYSDGYGGGYFSFGFEANKYHILDGIFSSDEGLKNFSATVRQHNQTVDISQLAPLLQDLYARGSNKKNQTTLNLDLVKVGKPLLIISQKKDELFDEISGFREKEVLFVDKNLNIRKTNLSNGEYPAFILRGKRLGQEARFFRLGLSRLYSELFILENIAEYLSSSRDLNIDAEGSDWIINRLNASVNRLTGADRPRFAKMEGFYARIVEEFSTLYRPGSIDELINRLCALGSTSGLNKRILESLKVQFNISDYRINQLTIEHVEKVEMNKTTNYNISGGNQGAVGDNAKATDFDQYSTNVTFQNIDLAKLSNEITQFMENLDQSMLEQSAVADIACLKVAQKAAEDGKVADVKNNLKKVGEWVIEKAGDLGLAVLKAAVLASLGLAA